MSYGCDFNQCDVEAQLLQKQLRELIKETGRPDNIY